jgi:hypothetical protein
MYRILWIFFIHCAPATCMVAIVPHCRPITLETRSLYAPPHIHTALLGISLSALQRQFRLCIPFLGIARPQSQFPHSCVWERFIQYIPRIGPHISSSRKGRPIVGIHNLLTDTWTWKLGLRPRYSFSGNICFKFSAFCLCSVVIAYAPVLLPYRKWCATSQKCI